jgi:hypothetical protein
MLKPTDMTIHWKALEEHFMMVPLVFQFDFRGKTFHHFCTDLNFVKEQLRNDASTEIKCNARGFRKQENIIFF